MLVLTGCPDQYARSYAKAGLGPEMKNEEYMRVQALYILNNMTYWRGENAKIVRENLKRIGKKGKI